MRIRRANKGDLREIGELMLEEFSKPPFNENVALDSVLKSLGYYYKNAEIYVAVDKNICGVLIFRVELWWEGKVVIIQDLAVKEFFQNKNIGSKLMGFLENFSKKKNIKKICFETNSKFSSIYFYKKLGYKLKRNRIVMEKKW